MVKKEFFNFFYLKKKMKHQTHASLDIINIVIALNKHNMLIITSN